MNLGTNRTLLFSILLAQNRIPFDLASIPVNYPWPNYLPLTSQGFWERFKVIKMKGDGRCLYRAISKAVYGDEEDWNTVVDRMLSWSKANLSDSTEHPLVYCWEKSRRTELLRQLEAAKAPQSSRDYGTAEHLWIAEYVFNIRTYCWGVNNVDEMVTEYQISAMPFPDGSDTAEPSKVVFLLYNGRDHFDYLIPRSR